MGRFQVLILLAFSVFVVQSTKKVEGGSGSLVKIMASWFCCGKVSNRYDSNSLILFNCFSCSVFFFGYEIRCLFGWYDSLLFFISKTLDIFNCAILTLLE